MPPVPAHMHAPRPLHHAALSSRQAAGGPPRRHALRPVRRVRVPCTTRSLRCPRMLAGMLAAPPACCSFYLHLCRGSTCRPLPCHDRIRLHRRPALVAFRIPSARLLALLLPRPQGAACNCLPAGGEEEAGPSGLVLQELLREEAPFMMLIQTGQASRWPAAAQTARPAWRPLACWCSLVQRGQDDLKQRRLQPAHPPIVLRTIARCACADWRLPDLVQTRPVAVCLTMRGTGSWRCCHSAAPDLRRLHRRAPGSTPCCVAHPPIRRCCWRSGSTARPGSCSRRRWTCAASGEGRQRGAAGSAPQARAQGVCRRGRRRSAEAPWFCCRLPFAV